MKQGWTCHRFDELFDLQMGKTPSRDNTLYWGGNNVWVSIADLNDKYIDNSKEFITNIAISESGIKLVPQNTVIMSFKLSVGKCAITKKDLYTNEAIMAFLPKEKAKLIVDFLYYSLKGFKWDGTNKAVKGITLNKASISKNIFSYPPLATQKQIVEELACIFHTQCSSTNFVS